MFKESISICWQPMDGRLLADAHSTEERDLAAERRQDGDHGGEQGQEMCLLEEIPPSTG